MFESSSKAFVFAICALAPAAAAQQPFVRITESQVRSVGSASAVPSSSQLLLSSAPVCVETAPAFDGMPVASGGGLQTVAFANPSNISSTGAIAFFSNVTGAVRNQGIFRADSSGLKSIAMGCGQGGGSGAPGSGAGDPTPIGGTFSGMFGGTVFAPAIDAAGDVLFISDVNGGSSSRGLFLYREATQSIVKVAAIGDASPYGGTLSAVGPGSMNDLGVIVFIAWGANLNDHQMLKWTNGALSGIARIGDAAPNGLTYTSLAGEYFTFVDGTSIPSGTVPDINNAGTIAFTAFANNSTAIAVVVQNGVASEYARTGDATPNGGTIGSIWGTALNENDEIAFYSDFVYPGNMWSGGWFSGSPGNWRKDVEFYDAIDGGVCTGLAVSRNPMQALADGGDVVFYANVTYSSGPDKEWIVVSRANGSLETVTGKGRTTVLGTTIGPIDAWPAMSSAPERCTVNCAASFSGVHLVEELCALPVAYCTAGTTTHGCTAQISGSGVPSASSTSGFTISVDALEGQRSGIVFYGVNGRLAAPWASGSSSLMCVHAPRQRTGVHQSGGTANACDGSFALDFNAYASSHPSAVGAPFQAGQTIDAQAWFRDPGAPSNTNLSNALEFQLEP